VASGRSPPTGRPVSNLVLLIFGVTLRLPDGGAYWLMAVVLLIAYETVLLANRGQTLAKMMLGLRVVRSDRASLSLRDPLIRRPSSR